MKEKDHCKLLEKYCSEVKIINSEILRLLNKRFTITRKIGIIKKKNGMNIRRKDVEKEIILKILKENKNKLDEKFLKELYSLIMKYSRKDQKAIIRKK
jgi:chorismate mutase